MRKGDILKKTSVQLSTRIQIKLDRALATVGDMALKRRAKRIIEELELKDGDKILEIGCGNGYYLSLLNRMGFRLELVGVDNDKLALADAKKYTDDNRVKLVCSAGEKLPFSNNTFDKIVMSEVIEHVQSEKLSLREAFRVLRPGGIFVLTTCNIDYPFLWDPINWILQYLFNTHIKSGFWAGIWNQHSRMYERKDMEKLIKEAKFNILLSEILTSWCLPFNHYVVNFIARLFYSGMLPRNVLKGMNKFKSNTQPFLVKLAFKLVNILDNLNDIFPLDLGVSIFVKARKN